MLTPQQILKKLQQQKDLNLEEATFIATTLMEGKLSDALVGACLFGLRQKGESAVEITAFAEVVKKYATKIPIDGTDLIDTAGTGGDHLSTFNISTTAALVLAAAGYKVAKHGNRSVTSNSGSADLLEALGINIYLTPEQVAKCIEQINIGFLFAPALHKFMKNVMPIRHTLGIGTVFNILGPLVNPAGAKTQIVGVFDQSLVWRLAQVLRSLKCKSAMVVSGNDGMDEVTLTSITNVAYLKPDGEIEILVFNPEDYGFDYVKIDALKGGTPKDNAQITMDVAYGKQGPKTDIVTINAGFAIAAAENCSIEEGIATAKHCIQNRKVKRKLEELIEVTQQLGKNNPVEPAK